jgi:hypothetical protein
VQLAARNNFPRRAASCRGAQQAAAARSKLPRRGKPPQAFTLIELLVVILPSPGRTLGRFFARF